MDNKYYTPDEDEFCKGFEYEVFEEAPKDIDPNWLTFVPVPEEDTWFKFKFPDPYVGWNLPLLLRRKIRVKYLDREDFEEVLNRKQLKGDDVELNFQVIVSDRIMYEFDYDTDILELTVEMFVEDLERGKSHCYPLFDGVVKNKLELKKLLKQLKIQ